MPSGSASGLLRVQCVVSKRYYVGSGLINGLTVHLHLSQVLTQEKSKGVEAPGATILCLKISFPEAGWWRSDSLGF